MQNQPGYSWGLDKPVNLMRSSKGWLAIFYSPDGQHEIIKIFNLSNTYYSEYFKMMNQLAEWNYGTCELCPIVKLEMEYG